MAKVMIFDGTKEKWLQFDEDTEVLVRHIDGAKLRKISAKAQKMANMGGGVATEHSNQLIGEEAVRGWRKIGDHSHPGFIFNGKPAPFTDANRNLFMQKWIKFSNFVNNNCTDSEAFVEEGELDAVKNG